MGLAAESFKTNKTPVPLLERPAPLASFLKSPYAQGSRALTFWPHIMPEVKASQMFPPPE